MPLSTGLQLPKGDISERGLRYLVAAAFGLLLFFCTLITLVILGARLPLGTLLIASNEFDDVTDGIVYGGADRARLRDG